MIFYQGDNIKFRVKATNYDLESQNFQVSFISNLVGCDTVMISKSEGNKLDDNYYEFLIPSNLTACMQSGYYNVEIFIQPSNVILSRFAFQLLKSRSTKLSSTASNSLTSNR